MNLTIELSSKSIQRAIDELNKKKNINNLIDILLERCCLWIKSRAMVRLLSSDLNDGVIGEIEKGWQLPVKTGKHKYTITNHGRAYAIEFGIGIKGEGTYLGDTPPNYEYNVQTKYKKADGSWIFKVDDIDTLDIMKKNVMPRPSGEVVYEEGRTIRTQGQDAMMFLYNAIIDFKNEKIASSLWHNILKEYFH